MPELSEEAEQEIRSALDFEDDVVTLERSLVISLLDELVELRDRFSGIVCATHDGIPCTDEESAAWEEGLDPCQLIVRFTAAGEVLRP